MNLQLRQLDLNLLLVFDALMIEQNLTRAATRLHMSQPAVSNALARLRRQVGETLFVRQARGMIPTARAHELHDPIRRALAILQEGFSPHPQFDPEGASHFTLALTDYGQLGVLPGLLARLRLRAPGMRLKVLRHEVAESLPQRLADGTLDLALDYIYVDNPNLLYQPLVDEELIVIGRTGHPAFEGGLTLAKFEQCMHVSIQPRPGRSAPLEIALGTNGLQRQVQAFVPNYMAIPATVAQTDLLGTVPRRFFDLFARFYPVQSAPFPIPVPPVQISMIWHRLRENSPGLQWLRQEIAAIASAESEDGEHSQSP